MTHYHVIKAIEFCYGHRLLEYPGNCKHLHGHNGLLEVTVSATQLDKLGMVIDFAVMRDVVKKWVDTHLDHRMILCKKDPFVPLLSNMQEPVFLMDENPTAENIAKLICTEMRKLDLNITEVKLWETSNNCAVYRHD